MPGLDEIRTIVIVMMENRSFDSVLGHLRHPRYGNRPEVEGLRNPSTTPDYDNFYENQAYKPFATPDRELLHDLPHTRPLIRVQLDVINNQPTMGGFVRSYVEATHSVVNKPPPMGFLTPRWVPMSGFLAQHYLLCNRWFSPLPTGTQPNRAVAFTGCSLIDDNVVGLIPHQDMVFDWLNAHGVRWRVYHSGISFFLLFGLVAEVLGDNFRSVRRLAQDIRQETIDEVPQVVFIEPEYADSPVHLGYVPNDNHPPLPIGPGEAFLRDVYSALTSNPAKWRRTLLLVTYDEHGGYFDHVSPPSMRTEPPQEAQYDPFDTLGMRVPTLAASPWVPRGGVHNDLFDHTSILQLLAEKFAGDPRGYSEEVNQRRDQGIRSASELLTEVHPRADVPEAPTAPIRATSLVQPATRAPANDNQAAFAAVARQLLQQEPDRALDRFPELALLPPEDA